VTSDAADPAYILVARQALADTAPHESWRQVIDDHRCHLRPPGPVQRSREWELVLSATPESAPDVLARAAVVLALHRVGFSFARDPRRLRELLAIRGDRRVGGFLTAHADGREQLRRLADDLHLATAGLTGPALAPDRPHRPGSLVHYRCP
jgi:hypothetical protein